MFWNKKIRHLATSRQYNIVKEKDSGGGSNNNNNTGNLYSAYPVAQSAEQYRLNTYKYIEIINVDKKENKNRKENVLISAQLDEVVQA